MPSRGKVAILGGGMAGLSAAWRLSSPGWQDRFDAITVYQRGWRLGGKAASSRGVHDRIEEHGLHIWLGSYENAFTLLRECYTEIDRATEDPECPIQTWDQALIPADELGMARVLVKDESHRLGLAAFKVPVAIRFVADTLPRTSLISTQARKPARPRSSAAWPPAAGTPQH